MIWTRDSEDALSMARRDKKIMSATNVKFGEILNELIDVTMKDLTKFERTKFETLITIHVHQKDIFEDLVSINNYEKLSTCRALVHELTSPTIPDVVRFSHHTEGGIVAHTLD